METSTASDARRERAYDLRLFLFELAIYLVLVVGLIASINGPTVHAL